SSAEEDRGCKQPNPPRQPPAPTPIHRRRRRCRPRRTPNIIPTTATRIRFIPTAATQVTATAIHPRFTLDSIIGATRTITGRTMGTDLITVIDRTTVTTAMDRTTVTNRITGPGPG